MLKLHVIASGSKGNASVVEDTSTGACICIDCGISAREFFEGLRSSGIAPENLRAILITHDHTDHTKGLGVVLRGLRKHGIEVPVFANAETRRVSADIRTIAEDFAFEDLELDRPLAFDGMDVLPFRTSHDAPFSCGFRLETGGDALGYLTDSGILTPEARAALARTRILALESNHDPTMLATGPYPSWLKARVGGERGHLSNVQAAEALDELRWPGLEQVIAMHISENNNTYLLPPKVLAGALGTGEGAPSVVSAFQHLPRHIC